MNVTELREQLADEAALEPVTVADPVGAVVGRARRARRRRRSAFAGVVVALATVVVVAIIAVRAPDRQGVVAPPTPRVEVLALSTHQTSLPGQYASEVSYVDTETGKTVGRSIPSNNYAEYPLQLFRIGDRLLMPGGKGVVSAPLDLSSPPRDMAPALVFVPSVHPDRFWAVTHFQFGNRPPYRVTEFDAAGRATAAELALPPDAGWPIAGTPEGLLMWSGTTDEVWLWDPSSRRVTRRIPGVPDFSGNGWIAGNVFAWVSPCGATLPTCASLHLLDLRTGVLRDLAPPPGFGGFGVDGAMSPDGRSLAVFVDRTRDPSDLGGRALALVDVATGRITMVPSSARTPSHVAWSPDGRTVYYGTDNATGIAFWHLGDPDSSQAATKLPSFSALIAAPVPS
jgi:hypothetical protein